MSTPATHLLNGRYVLEPEPRKGGMARVHRATDLEEDGALVAVKIIVTSDHRLSSKVFEREERSLRRLDHPHVVKLLDGGRDEESGSKFLVFEWVEEDLESRLRGGWVPEGWDDFVDQLGQPLFQALAVAHTQSVAHRDIKPANILIDADGTPKLADFGIAKITTDAAPGLTIADFRSEPFAAPHAEGPHRHTSGDVYSLGVTALAILSGVDYRQARYEEYPRTFVDEALGAVDVPEEASEFLARVTAKELEDRPANGPKALLELEEILVRRQDQAKRLGYETVPTCYLSLGRKVRTSLVEEFELESESEADALLLADLGDKVVFLAVPPKADQSEQKGTTFYLYGSELRLHLAPVSNAPVLRVLSTQRAAGSQLDRDQHKTWSGLVRFTMDQPQDSRGAAQELADLLDQVHAAARGDLRDGPEDEVIQTWRRSLAALNEIDRGREEPLVYQAFRQAKDQVIFRLVKSVGSRNLAGQQRTVSLIDGSTLVGTVTRATGTDLELRVEQGNARQLPGTGKLRVDMRLSQAALRRQESALDALQRGTVARPDLKRILCAPASAHPPEQVPEPEWAQEALDEPKRHAVRAAMGSPDMLLVEGPPGTGKTTMIAELVSQELARNPGMRILVSSQTHSALDNVLERLARLTNDGGPTMLRVGRPGHEAISEGVEHLLVGARLQEWRREVIAGGHSYLRDWAASHQISSRDVEIAMRLDELAAVLDSIETTRRKLADANERLNHLRDTRQAGGETSNETVAGVQDQVSEHRDELESLNAQGAELVERLVELDRRDKDELEALSQEQLRTLANEKVDRSHPEYEKCSKLIKLLGDWHARFGRGPEFEAAALLRAQVVAGTCVGLAAVPGWGSIEFDLCILDEASKANATEALIPLSRAHRWVLVGDHRQLPSHIDDALLDTELLSRFELSEEQLRETTFERLRRHLPEASRVLLSEQHRMVPALGDLISHCFYEGSLQSAFSERPHWLQAVMKTPVVWLSTSDLARRAEKRAGSGRSNPTEARCVKNLLGSLNFVADAAKKQLSVAVLAGYREQCEEITRQIAGELPTWQALTVDCNTVDAFQGREADIAVYSVTRSNLGGNLGFLIERERLNVALSRGRLGLAIVGDEEFAHGAKGDNPFRQVLEYMSADPACSFEEARP